MPVTVTVTEPDAIHLAPIGPWSTDAPTKDGWYWAAFPFGDDAWIKVHVKVEGDVCYSVRGEEDGEEGKLAEWRLASFTHWLGPLPVPEPPEDV